MSGGGEGGRGGAFGGADLTALRAMIANAHPDTLDSVAAKWAAVDLALQQAQQDFLHHTRAATSHWTGTAADAFTARAAELHDALGAGAAYASHASSGVSYAADALRAARYDMPPGPACLDGVATAEQAWTTSAAADVLHEQQRRQAVAVMETLEQRYAAAADMFGNPEGTHISCDRGAFSTSNRPGVAPQQASPASSNRPYLKSSTHETAGSTLARSSNESPGYRKDGAARGSSNPPESASPEKSQPMQAALDRHEMSNIAEAGSPGGPAGIQNPEGASIQYHRTGTSRLDAQPAPGNVPNFDNAPRGDQLSASDAQQPGIVNGYNPPAAQQAERPAGQRIGHGMPLGRVHQRVSELQPVEALNRPGIAPGAAQRLPGSRIEARPGNRGMNQSAPAPEFGLAGLPSRTFANSRRTRGRRPDYLTGDPDEWLSGIPVSNPPVIDH